MKNIDKKNPLYKEAKLLIRQADSLDNFNKMTEEEKFEVEKMKRKSQLEKELILIKKEIDFSKYRGSLEKLEQELALFGTWANIIKLSEEYNDREITKLSLQLKNQITKIQRNEFPQMRTEYGKILAQKLWREDINVYTNGKGAKYINFTGGHFAANANKQDFHLTGLIQLQSLKFNQSRYRWYKGQKDYTSWSISKSDDSELVDLAYIQNFFKPIITD